MRYNKNTKTTMVLYDLVGPILSAYTKMLSKRYHEVMHSIFMLMASLFTIVKILNELICSSTDE